MELSEKRAISWRGITGIAGAVVLACTACCLPLFAPVLAWLGVAGLALMGPYGILAAVLGAVIIGWAMVVRRRKRSQCKASVNSSSNCQASCSTTPKAPGGQISRSQDEPAPIACTLSSADFKERARWLNELKTRALLSHRYEGRTVHLSYRLDAADDVEKMVLQEQACCSFLHFDLRRARTTMELTITAPAEAADDAKVLFAHLVP